MGLLAPILAAIVLVVGIGSYYKGRESRSDEIAELTAAIETSRKLAEDAEARANAASARVVVEYRDRVKTITERLPGEIQLVEVIRETPGLCPLPPIWRRVWDGGAAPDRADVEAASGIDGAPVPVADAAAAVIEARKRFDENAARLTALQDWINAQ